MKSFPLVVLALCALGFFAFGLWLFADPGALVPIGIHASSGIAQAELRAFYGGMELGLGLFLGLCALRPAWREAGLWLVLLANGGAGLARLSAILLGGLPLRGYLGWALGWELGFALLGALALARKPA
jgi:hypothetical protein